MQAVPAMHPANLHRRVLPAGHPGRRLRADAIGCRVKLLGDGSVEAVFERACILRMDGGAMVAVLARRAGNVAHGIRLAGDLPHDIGLRAGVPICIDAQCVSFDDGAVLVGLSTARVWAPELRPGTYASAGGSPNAAALVRDLLRRDAAESGSEFLAHTLGLERTPTLLSARLAQTLQRLGPAARCDDQEGALSAVAHLIGLGPGLTPAGDDFIIGWLAGLTLTARTPAALRFLHAVCVGIEGMRSATTSVSSQHLDDACALMFSERLCDVCIAIARDAPAVTLAARVSAQLAVGATSGADAAAGLMFALFDCGTIDR
jgi:hypothetical protein